MFTNLDSPEWAEGFRAGKAGGDGTPPLETENAIAWACGYREGLAVKRFQIDLLTIDVMRTFNKKPDNQ